MNQTWLPSHTGPIVLIAMRRSVSDRATHGSNAIEPRSNPSMTAKPISKTPSRAHQINRKTS